MEIKIGIGIGYDVVVYGGGDIYGEAFFWKLLNFKVE
jgi:hypothetical protein